MPLLVRAMLVDLFGIRLQPLVDGLTDLLIQRRLVLLDGQHVVAAAFTKLRGDLLLTAHRVDGHDRPGEFQHLQQLGNGCDLVGFLIHDHLTERQLVLRSPSRDPVDGGLAVLPIVGAPQGLAVDGDQPALGDLLDRLHPGQQGLLEGHRIESGAHASKGILTGDTRLYWN